MQENSTISINCLLDLEGQTVNVPAGGTFEFDGGTISNGTLNFSSTGKIDGDLLNADLTVEGGVTLISEIFNFYPERWDIVQGEVSLEQAGYNHIGMQYVLDLVDELSPVTGTDKLIFQIDELNLYVESYYLYNKFAAMLIPSNFHLKMSENTTFRVKNVPNWGNSTQIFRIYKESNVEVSGGNLIGDRIEKGATLGGQVLFAIKGGQDVVIEDMNLSYSSSSGLTINSEFFPGDPNYIISKNILVSNCTFESNRANGLSITDGEFITVDGNKLHNTAVQIDDSIVRAPGIAIVVEPVEGQQTNNITISNNIETGSKGSAILVAWGEYYTISGNTTEKNVGWTGASYVSVIDNPSLGGISGGIENVFDDLYEAALNLSVGHVIARNVVENSDTGIKLWQDNIQVYNNTIKNCGVGIMLRQVKNTNIYDNTIESDVSPSWGINAQIDLEDIEIKNNTITLSDGRPFLFEYLDSDEIIFEKNTFNTAKTGNINYCEGSIDIVDNTFNEAGFVVTSSKGISIDNNKIYHKISGSTALTIENYTTLNDINITNNHIENQYASGSNYGIQLKVVNNDYSTSDSDVTISGNKIITDGNSSGIYAESINGVIINDNDIENIGTTGFGYSIYFRGNNSSITNNITDKEVDINGVNNTVSNN